MAEYTASVTSSTYQFFDLKRFNMDYIAHAKKVLFGAAAISATALIAPAMANADRDGIPFGATESINRDGGAHVIDFAVRNLRPSGNNDGIYIADVAATSSRGTTAPDIRNFNAVARNGQSYGALLGTQPQGIPDVNLSSGKTASGRVYFNVGAGTPPDSVVYRNDNDDELIWR